MKWTTIGLVISLLAASLALTSAPAGASEVCVGAIDADIDQAKRNYGNRCGQTYSDTSGFHKCSWVTGGWQCEGPGGSAHRTPDPDPIDAIDYAPPRDTGQPGIHGWIPAGEADDGPIEVSSLRELRDAGLPTFAQEDALVDLGLLTVNDKTGALSKPLDHVWAGLTSSELDEPFEVTMTFDPIRLAEVQYYVDNPGTASPVQQPRGFCSKRWRDKKKSFALTDEVGSDSLGLATASKDLGNGFNATFSSQAVMDGALDVTGDVYYRQRERKCLGIPYRFDLQHVDIDVHAEIDGDINVENTLTIEYQERLWEHTLNLLRAEVTISIKEIITVRAELDLDVALALDVHAMAKMTESARVAQEYIVDGSFTASLRCDEDGCERRDDPEWNLDFTPFDRSEQDRQVTVDLQIIPSAELRLSLDVYLGVLRLYEERVFRGVVAAGIRLPIRLFWTAGQGCSDANGDGVNERVEALILDASIELYAYLRGRLGGQTAIQAIRLHVPNGWTRNVLIDALGVDQQLPTIRKNLTWRLLDVGQHSPLEPVINRAGTFDTAGAMGFEGIEIAGVRSCYPFADTPTLEIDFGDGDRHTVGFATTQALRVAHDWAEDFRGSARVRVISDSAGRTINGPWVTVPVGGPPAELRVPVLRLGTGATGPELVWEDNGAASGFNIYIDGKYETTVRGTTSWPLDGRTGSHRYSIVAFDDAENRFTPRSEEVSYDGSSGTDRPRAAVAMGDSFISGEGGRWYGNAVSGSSAGTDRGRRSYVGSSEANDCHRSDTAEINAAGIPGLVPINLACSGAETNHVRTDEFKGERPQVEQLRDLTQNHDVELIALSIGGNDLGFGPILQECIVAFLTDGGSCRRNDIYGDIERNVMPEVRATIRDIQDVMRQAGDTNYRLVLQSYPSPVPRSSETRYPEPSARFNIDSKRAEGGCPFFDDDLDWARDTIVPILDERYRSLATELGIEFLSLRDAMQGKEVCANGVRRASTADPADASDAGELEWMRFGNAAVHTAQGGEVGELLHPNALGQGALGRCLRGVWERAGQRLHECGRNGTLPSHMIVR